MSSKTEASREPMLRPAGSLATRLTAWYAGSAFTLVALASGILYFALVVNLEREDDEELGEKVRTLADLCRSSSDIPSVQALIEHRWASRQFAQIYARVARNGDTLAETPGFSTTLRLDQFPAPLEDGMPKNGEDVQSPN